MVLCRKTDRHKTLRSRVYCGVLRVAGSRRIWLAGRPKTSQEGSRKVGIGCCYRQDRVIFSKPGSNLPECWCMHHRAAWTYEMDWGQSHVSKLEGAETAKPFGAKPPITTFPNRSVSQVRPFTFIHPSTDLVGTDRDAHAKIPTTIRKVAMQKYTKILRRTT